MKTTSSAGTPANFSDNSLTVMHDPEDVIPFIMLHTDRSKAIEEYRINVIGGLVKTFKGSQWRNYIIDHTKGKCVDVSFYTSDGAEQEELSQLEHAFSHCDYVKRRIDEECSQDCKKLTLQSVLDGYSEARLLSELRGMYDAQFARHIQKLHEKGYILHSAGGTLLHDILLQYFDKVPAVQTFNKAIRGEYGENEQIRPPKNFTPRNRVDIK